jgi:type II secretory pathway component PulC
MKLGSQLLYIFVALSIFPLSSPAEPKNLNAVMAKATPQELNDLSLLLKQITLKPAGNSMMEVVRFEKGSVFDREGIKVGDLLSTTNPTTTNSPQKAMKLYQKMKATKESPNTSAHE